MQKWTVSLARRPRFALAERYFRTIATKRKSNDQKLGGYGIGDDDVTPLDFADTGVKDSELQYASDADDRYVLSVYEGADEPAEPDLTPEDVHPPFAKAFIQLDNDVRTHRFRKHGNSPLPLSPVIDPVFVAARNRWKMKKGLPLKQEELTPFQKKLHNNPYAQALATSVRETQTTNTHLPRFFLLPLDLRRSPVPPHNLTWLPSRLWAKNSLNPVGGDLKMTGPQSHVDLSRQMLDLLSRQGTKVKEGIATGAHHRTFTRNTKKELVLRKDLGAFVLDLLRQGVMKSLVWLFRHPKTGMVERCDGGAYAIEGKANVGCVVYTGSMYSPVLADITARVTREVHNAENLGRRVRGMQIAQHGRLPADDKIPFTADPAPIQNPAAVYPPFEYPITLDSLGRAVPVYSLTDLLGDQKTAELLQATMFEDAECVVVREDERSVKVQMALLRLQNFLSLGLSVSQVPRKKSVDDGDGGETVSAAGSRTQSGTEIG